MTEPISVRRGAIEMSRSQLEIAVGFALGAVAFVIALLFGLI